MEDIIKEPVAKITKVYSDKGEFQLRLYNSFEDYVDIKEPLFVEIDSLEVPVFIGMFLKRGSSKATITIDDIDNEIRANEFVGKELYLYVEQEQDDELYYENMVGFEIKDTITNRTGKIIEYCDYKDNPLFSVDFNGIEVMVPINEDIIIEINEETRIVTVKLPDGLIELYENIDE